MGLYATTSEAIYRRDCLTWAALTKHTYREINNTKGIEVSYRFIKAYDALEARGQRPDWNLANRMRVFNAEPPKDCQP